MVALLRHFGADVKDAGTGWSSIRCPFHDDTHSSASFNETEGVFKCHGCGVQGRPEDVLAKVSGLGSGEVEEFLATLPERELVPGISPRYRRQSKDLSGAAATYSSNVHLVSEYLRQRGIGRDEAVAGGLGYVVVPAPGHEQMVGRMTIPYTTSSGVVDIRFRAVDGETAPKYMSLPGSKPRMYQAPLTLLPSPFIVITEGELDALILWRCLGIPAVGVPGASQWQPHWERVLEGYETVLVCGDGDDAGRRFAKEMTRKIESAVQVALPDGHDINSWYVEQGAAAVLELLPQIGESYAVPAMREVRS
jgi:DNA primase